MRPHKSFADVANVEAVTRRIASVNPSTPRQWGTLTAHEMFCHLADSFLVSLGEKTASSSETLLSRSVVKWIALHTSLPWPHGVPTRPEVNPHIAGAKPVEFERDRQRVIELIHRFTAPTAKYGRHPGFGTMSREEWLLWGFGHADHHLRQFGV